MRTRIQAHGVATTLIAMTTWQTYIAVFFSIPDQFCGVTSPFYLCLHQGIIHIDLICHENPSSVRKSVHPPDTHTHTLSVFLFFVFSHFEGHQQLSFSFYKILSAHLDWLKGHPASHRHFGQPTLRQRRRDGLKGGNTDVSHFLMNVHLEHSRNHKGVIFFIIQFIFCCL